MKRAEKTVAAQRTATTKTPRDPVHRHLLRLPAGLPEGSDIRTTIELINSILVPKDKDAACEALSRLLAFLIEKNKSDQLLVGLVGQSMLLLHTCDTLEEVRDALGQIKAAVRRKKGTRSKKARAHD